VSRVDSLLMFATLLFVVVCVSIQHADSVSCLIDFLVLWHCVQFFGCCVWCSVRLVQLVSHFHRMGNWWRHSRKTERCVCFKL